jgi:hypothetical protein
VVELPFVSRGHGHCHDEGVWSPHRFADPPWVGSQLGLRALLVSPFPAKDLGIVVNTGIQESSHALRAGTSGVGRTARQFGCQWL